MATAAYTAFKDSINAAAPDVPGATHRYPFVPLVSGQTTQLEAIWTEAETAFSAIAPAPAAGRPAAFAFYQELNKRIGSLGPATTGLRFNRFPPFGQLPAPFMDAYAAAAAAIGGAPPVGIAFPDMILNSGTNGATLFGYKVNDFGSVNPDVTSNDNLIRRLTVSTSGQVRFSVGGPYDQDEFATLEIVGVGTLNSADADYTVSAAKAVWVWSGTGLSIDDGETYAVEFE